MIWQASENFPQGDLAAITNVGAAENASLS